MSDKQWTLAAIVEQLKGCGYSCEAGSLENNVAFKALEDLAKPKRIDRATGMMIERDARAQVIARQIYEYCEAVGWGRGIQPMYWLEVELIIADALRIYDAELVDLRELFKVTMAEIHQETEKALGRELLYSPVECVRKLAEAYKAVRDGKS